MASPMGDAMTQYFPSRSLFLLPEISAPKVGRLTCFFNDFG